jgi:hypothetical protein
MSTETADETPTSDGGYTFVSVSACAISYVYPPILFGPVALFAGVQVYRRHSKRRGVGLIALAIISSIVASLTRVL